MRDFLRGSALPPEAETSLLWCGGEGKGGGRYDEFNVHGIPHLITQYESTFVCLNSNCDGNGTTVYHPTSIYEFGTFFTLSFISLNP